MLMRAMPWNFVDWLTWVRFLVNVSTRRCLMLIYCWAPAFEHEPMFRCFRALFNHFHEIFNDFPTQLDWSEWNYLLEIFEHVTTFVIVNPPLILGDLLWIMRLFNVLLQFSIIYKFQHLIVVSQSSFMLLTCIEFPWMTYRWIQLSKITFDNFFRYFSGKYFNDTQHNRRTITNSERVSEATK